jgi:cysteine synthase
MTLLDFRLIPSEIDSGTDLSTYVVNTPLLPLRHLTLRHAQGSSRELSPRVKVFAKAEWFNPGGSVKNGNL